MPALRNLAKEVNEMNEILKLQTMSGGVASSRSMSTVSTGCGTTSWSTISTGCK